MWSDNVRVCWLSPHVCHFGWQKWPLPRRWLGHMSVKGHHWAKAVFVNQVQKHLPYQVIYRTNCLSLFLKSYCLSGKYFRDAIAIFMFCDSFIFKPVRIDLLSVLWILTCVWIITLESMRMIMFVVYNNSCYKTPENGTFINLFRNFSCFIKNTWIWTLPCMISSWEVVLLICGID